MSRSYRNGYDDNFKKKDLKKKSKEMRKKKNFKENIFMED